MLLLKRFPLLRRKKRQQNTSVRIQLYSWPFKEKEPNSLIPNICVAAIEDKHVPLTVHVGYAVKSQKRKPMWRKKIFRLIFSIKWIIFIRSRDTKNLSKYDLIKHFFSFGFSFCPFTTYCPNMLKISITPYRLYIH